MAWSRRKSETFFQLTGIGAGVVLVGLLLPYVVGDATPPTASSTGPAGVEASAGDGLSPSDSSGAASASPGSEPEETSTPGANGPAGSTESGTSGGTTSASSNEPRTASDVGIGPGVIKVGVGVLDLGGANRVGVNAPSVDPETQKAAWSAYFDAVNDADGINGRKIEYTFDTYDVLGQEDKRRSCLRLTEDVRAFIVLDPGGYENKDVLCFTEEHGTPLITSGVGTGNYQRATIDRAKGLLFILFPTTDRTFANLPAEMAGAGIPKTAKIGILGDDRTDPSGRAVDGSLVPALESMGYEVTHRSRMSEDLNTAASQVPVEVQQMYSKGVDHVILATSLLLATPFGQNAEARRWRPQYIVTDFGTGYSDTYGANQPDSFEGSVLFTTSRNNEWRLDRPLPEYDAGCLKRFRDGAGQEMDRTTISSNVTVQICTIHDRFVDAMRRAGVNPTRASMSAALQNTGPFPIGNAYGGEWRPGRFDAATHVRTGVWRLNCKTSSGNSSRKCWLPASEFRPFRV